MFISYKPFITRFLLENIPSPFMRIIFTHCICKLFKIFNQRLRLSDIYFRFYFILSSCSFYHICNKLMSNATAGWTQFLKCIFIWCNRFSKYNCWDFSGKILPKILHIIEQQIEVIFRYTPYMRYSTKWCPLLLCPPN